jgi:hypothetical protein
MQIAGGHRCTLMIADIISSITENTSSLDLLSLALVSRAISPHALRVLWRVLPSPVPLLKLLPNVSFMEGSWVGFLS